MKTVNLREHYPEYELDCLIEVADGDADAFIAGMTKEVADVYIEAQRAENAYRRRVYYHKAHYSLDAGDGIENDAVCFAPSPEALFVEKLTHEQIAAALASLPETQCRRVAAHFCYGKTFQTIAEAEGVDESAVRTSIKRALRTLKNYLI